MAEAILSVSVKDTAYAVVVSATIETESLESAVHGVWAEVLDESVTPLIDLNTYAQWGYPVVVRKSQITGVAAYFTG